MLDLARPDRWQNLFQINFFVDEKRKWKSRRNRDLVVSTSQDKDSAFLVDERYGTSLHITKKPGKKYDVVIVTDEDGHSIHYRNGKIKTDFWNKFRNHVSLSRRSSINRSGEDENVYEISDFGLFLRLNENGSRTISFKNSTQEALLPPRENRRRKPHANGRFFHVISFNSAASDEFGLSLTDLKDYVKIILAREIGLEPDLKAINELDPDRFVSMAAEIIPREYDPDWSGPEQWRPEIKKSIGDLRDIEKTWHDVTQFKGYSIDTPSRFAISRTHRGFDIQTSLDHREQILAQGRVLKNAFESSPEPFTPLNTNKMDRTLLHFLNHGEETEDHKNRQWRYVVIQSEQSAVLSHRVRELCRQNLGLEQQDFSAINHDDDKCILAMNAHALKRAFRAYDASTEMLALIKENSKDVNRMLSLLEKGADLRFVEPGTKGARSFADLMRETGNNTLLTALQDKYGARDFTPEVN